MSPSSGAAPALTLPTNTVSVDMDVGAQPVGRPPLSQSHARWSSGARLATPMRCHADEYAVTRLAFYDGPYMYRDTALGTTCE